MNSQYKKGVLELCVLSLLRGRDRYGYEISEYLSQHIDIADGTVYPLLRKLKADGLSNGAIICALGIANVIITVPNFRLITTQSEHPPRARRACPSHPTQQHSGSR